MTFSKLSSVLRWALIASVLSLAGVAVSQVNVTTYHNDNQRTGLNSSEKILTYANVNQNTFGLLFNLPVDGFVYAQPLYLSAVQIPGKGAHNVVYIATEHNSVYAFDADSNQGADATPLWQVNLGPSVPNGEVGTGDIVPEIGITGTPVIYLPPTNPKRSTPTIYLVAKTKELDSHNNTVYVQRLHALDATTGAERAGSPVVVQARVNGTGDDTDGTGHITFDPLIHNQRPALLLMPPAKGGSGSGTVYVAWASHGDNGPYHGWIISYDADSLKKLAVYNTTANAKTDPSGYPLAAGGIWQGGAGLASDGDSIYFATGNGTFSPVIGAYGDSIVRMSLDLTLQDYFSPFNQQGLDDSDADLGSGAVILLPREAGSSKVPSLLIQSGKQGTVYLLDTQNLGKNNPGFDHIVGELPNAMNGQWGCPAYFNGNVYFGPYNSSLVSFPIKNGGFASKGYTSQSPDFYGYPGPSPAVSSDGNAHGIVWAVEADGWSSGGQSYLKAYQANNLANELYNSGSTSGRDTLGGAVKFTVPTVANGKVYVGSAYSVGVFGLGKWTAIPQIVTPSGNYADHVSVTINDSTPGAKIYYTTDGSVPTTSSNLYHSPITFFTSVNLNVRAFATGYSSSQVASAYYQINAFIGTGNGLLGNYFANSQDPTTGTPTASRLDPVINFNWNESSPIAGVGGDNWAAQWTGHIQAEDSQTYTFYTYSDDGVRVFVNGQEIINNWSYHPPTVDTGTIILSAGVKYTIVVDYFQGGGGSLLSLSWSAPGMPEQIVPTSQLYYP